MNCKSDFANSEVKPSKFNQSTMNDPNWLQWIDLCFRKSHRTSFKRDGRQVVEKYKRITKIDQGASYRTWGDFNYNHSFCFVRGETY